MVTEDELLEWDPTLDGDDPRLSTVLDRAIEVVRFAGKADWDVQTAPGRAKTICLIVARRELVNPDHETSSGVSVISSRVTDAEAAGLMLTDLERDELRELAGRWTGGGGGALWRMSLTDQTSRPRPVYVNGGPEGDNTPIYYLGYEGNEFYFPTRD